MTTSSLEHVPQSRGAAFKLRQALTTLAAICIFTACCARYYHATIAIQVPGLTDSGSDFLPYHQAARHIIHGESPFLTDGYIYPPLFAFALTPLAPIDYVTARRIWFGISQLFLIAAAILLWRGFGRDLATACWIAFVWAEGGSAEESLGLGQVGPLITLLVTIALTSRRGRQGAAVAAGFAIKLFPGLLGFAVLLRRDRRAIAWMMLGALAAVLLPWAAVAAFFHGPVGANTGGSWTGTPATLSWGMPSVVLRALDPPHVAYPLPRNWEAGTDLQHFRLPPGSAMAGLATALLVLGGGLYYLGRRTRFRLSDEQVPWAMAALMALALAASPVSWTHYQIMQYPGVALLLAHLWRGRRWKELLAGLALAALLYPVPVEILRGYYTRYNAWTANSPVGLYTLTSVTPIASLILFWMLVREAERQRSPVPISASA